MALQDTVPTLPPMQQSPWMRAHKGQFSVENDPWFQQNLGLLQAQSVADLAEAQRQLQTALVDYGMIPEGATLGLLTDPAPNYFPNANVPAPKTAEDYQREIAQMQSRISAGQQRNERVEPALAQNPAGLARYQEIAGKQSASLAEQLAALQAAAAESNDPLARLRAQAEAATEAGLSVWAKLAKQHALNERGIKRSLAARGMLRSGETGYQLGEEALGFKQAGYESQRDLLGFLAGVQHAFTQSELARQQQLLGSLQQAQQSQTQAAQNYYANLTPAGNFNNRSPVWSS